MACDGGSGFVPEIGPYAGEFVAGEEVVGTFNLTYTGGLLGGTGSLTHFDYTATVTISAALNGHEISGTVENATYGSGPFEGRFSGNGNTGIGTFSFTDIPGNKTTEGTWTFEMQ
jgi:hypothetical protein